MDRAMDDPCSSSEISDALTSLEKLDDANLLLVGGELDRMRKRGQGQPTGRNGRVKMSKATSATSSSYLPRTDQMRAVTSFNVSAPSMGLRGIVGSTSFSRAQNGESKSFRLLIRLGSHQKAFRGA
jgi:hypothetical protein